VDPVACDGGGELTRLLREQAYGFASCRAGGGGWASPEPSELLGRFRRAAELGWAGLLTAPEHGGEGAGWPEAAVVIEETAAGEPPLAAMLISHLSCCRGVALWGRAERLGELLSPLARGERLGAVGLTEPEVGTDLAEPRAALSQREGALVVNGNKCFVANASQEPFELLTLARGEGGTAALLLPSEAPGLHVAHRYLFSGWEGLPNHALVLQDCVVPEGRLLRERLGRGELLELLDGAWLLAAALAAGMGRACLEEASAYARERRQGGRRLAEHQSVAFRLADMATGLEVLRTSLYPAAHRLQRGEDIHAEICMLKLYAAGWAEEAASSAVEICGGFGYTLDSRVSALWRASKGLKLLWGTRELARLELARCLGLSQ